MIEFKKVKMFKEFLVAYNPNEESAREMIEFLRRWIEYRQGLKRHVEEQYKESVNAQFLALMARTFKQNDLRRMDEGSGGTEPDHRAKDL